MEASLRVDTKPPKEGEGVRVSWRQAMASGARCAEQRALWGIKEGGAISHSHCEELTVPSWSWPVCHSQYPTGNLIQLSFLLVSISDASNTLVYK